MINIFIDKLTDCLIKRDTEKIVNTSYSILERKLSDNDIATMHRNGWSSNFNWKEIQKEGFTIVQLYAEDDERVQGLIAYKHHKEDLYTFVPLVEAAPWNIGKTGEYIGVGGHLFAIACKASWDAGNEGFVMFEAKTDIAEHYMETLQAEILDYNVPIKMVLDTSAAAMLIHKYLLEKEE